MTNDNYRGTTQLQDRDYHLEQRGLVSRAETSLEMPPRIEQPTIQGSLYQSCAEGRGIVSFPVN